MNSLTIKDLDTGKSFSYDDQQLIYQRFKVIRKLNDKENLQFQEILENYQLELIYFAQTGNITKMKKLLQDIPILNINCISLDNWTPLHFAAFQNQYDALQFLINKGANLNVLTSMNRTALHLSVIRNNIQVTIILLNNSIDLNYQDYDFCTATHYASIYGYKQMLALLLSYKPDIQPLNCQGMTAYQCAYDYEIIKIFQQFQCIKINSKNSYSRMTLLRSILLKNGRSDHVKKLIYHRQRTSSFNNTISTKDSENQIHENKNNLKKIPIVKVRQEKKFSLNDFEIISKIGQGSFGQVLLVKKKNHQTLYAMKVLSKSKIKKHNLKKYAMTQKNILKIINHPFIVKSYYAFQSKSQLFLVNHFYPGGDLSQYLYKKQKLQEHIAHLYINQIILALQQLHRNQIIYRDLKPGNIVIDQKGHALLTDFGLSKFGTQGQSFCGSIAYLAPQMLERKKHGYSLDWYTLGVLSYELLTGLPPYYSNTKQKIFYNIKYGKLQYPNFITKDCKNFLSRLLQRDPNKRLGNKKDAQEVKKHPWFSKINWKYVYQRKQIMPNIIKQNYKNFKTKLDLLQQSPFQVSNWQFYKQ